MCLYTPKKTNTLSEYTTCSHFFFLVIFYAYITVDSLYRDGADAPINLNIKNSEMQQLYALFDTYMYSKSVSVPIKITFKVYDIHLYKDIQFLFLIIVFSLVS